MNPLKGGCHVISAMNSLEILNLITKVTKTQFELCWWFNTLDQEYFFKPCCGGEASVNWISGVQSECCTCCTERQSKWLLNLSRLINWLIFSGCHLETEQPLTINFWLINWTCKAAGTACCVELILMNTDWNEKKNYLQVRSNCFEASLWDVLLVEVY